MEICVCNLEVAIPQILLFLTWLSPTSHVTISSWTQIFTCKDSFDRFCKRFLTCHFMQFTFCQQSLPRAPLQTLYRHFKLNCPNFPPFDVTNHIASCKQNYVRMTLPIRMNTKRTFWIQGDKGSYLMDPRLGSWASRIAPRGGDFGSLASFTMRSRQVTDGG